MVEQIPAAAFGETNKSKFRFQFRMNFRMNWIVFLDCLSIQLL